MGGLRCTRGGGAEGGTKHVSSYMVHLAALVPVTRTGESHSLAWKHRLFVALMLANQ